MVLVTLKLLTDVMLVVLATRTDLFPVGFLVVQVVVGLPRVMFSGMPRTTTDMCQVLIPGMPATTMKAVLVVLHRVLVTSTHLLLALHLKLRRIHARRAQHGQG